MSKPLELPFCLNGYYDANTGHHMKHPNIPIKLLRYGSQPFRHRVENSMANFYYGVSIFSTAEYSMAYPFLV
jgi:hypothetical protein